MRDLRAAEGCTIVEPAVNISIFAGFVLVTLFITFRASRNNKSAADYYAAGRDGRAVAGHRCVAHNKSVSTDTQPVGMYLE